MTRLLLAVAAVAVGAACAPATGPNRADVARLHVGRTASDLDIAAGGFWCDEFVTHVLALTGSRIPKRTGAPSDFLAFPAVTEPQAGGVVIVQFRIGNDTGPAVRADHVGILTELAGDQVVGVFGNEKTQGTTGVVERSYPFGDVVEIVRPS